MNKNNPAGGNGRALRFPAGQAMGQAKPGGLVLPPQAAAQRAKDLASKFDKHHLVWCPTLGANELPNGTECAWGKSPLPPYQPVLFYRCPTCEQMHMVAIVLAPKSQDSEAVGALDPEDIVTVEQIFKAGQDAATSCVEVWPMVAVYHLERADFAGQLGRPHAKLTLNAMNAEFVSCGEAAPKPGSGSEDMILIDGDDKADLNARIAEYVRGLEDGESGRPVYQGPEKTARTAWLAREKK